MANKCFNGILGIRTSYGVYTASKSGYYIDDAEGINLEFAGAIGSAAYKSGIDLIEKKIEYAANIVKDEILLQFVDSMRLNKIIESSMHGRFTSGYNSNGTGNAGIKIKKPKYPVRPYTSIRITSIEISVMDDCIIDLYIKDGKNEKVYESVELKGGYANELILQYLCDTETPIIYFDQTGISPQIVTMNRYGCSTCGGASYEDVNKLHVVGWNGTTETAGQYGITASLQMECNIDKIMCQIAPHLALPILYKAVAEIYREACHAQGGNKFTLFRGEQNLEMADKYDALFINSLPKFVLTISKLLKSIKDECITCHTTGSSYALP
jgi:hypothetical protein